MFTPQQIGDRRIHSDADAPEADENPLQDLLLALDVDEGQALVGRFACGWNRFGSVLAARRDIGRSIRLGFLALGRFAATTSATSFGLSCSNLYFSMGYEA
jgi:hypothetical protein